MHHGEMEKRGHMNQLNIHNVLLLNAPLSHSICANVHQIHTDQLQSILEGQRPTRYDVY